MSTLSALFLLSCPLLALPQVKNILKLERSISDLLCKILYVHLVFVCARARMRACLCPRMQLLVVFICITCCIRAGVWKLENTVFHATFKCACSDCMCACLHVQLLLVVSLCMRACARSCVLIHMYNRCGYMGKTPMILLVAQSSEGGHVGSRCVPHASFEGTVAIALLDETPPFFPSFHCV